MLLSFCHNCHPFYLGKQITPPVLTDRGALRPGVQMTALVLTERGAVLIRCSFTRFCCIYL